MMGSRATGRLKSVTSSHERALPVTICQQAGHIRSRLQATVNHTLQPASKFVNNQPFRMANSREWNSRVYKTSTTSTVATIMAMGEKNQASAANEK